MLVHLAATTLMMALVLDSFSPEVTLLVECAVLLNYIGDEVQQAILTYKLNQSTFE